MSRPRTDKTYAVGDVPWLYPHRDAPPRGVKLNILQQGGVTIHDQWRPGYIAWQYLFRRDKALEEEARLFSLTEEVMTDGPLRKFRVPLTLPAVCSGWRRVLNVRWFEGDIDVAAIFKLIDDEGYTTPITYQYDYRNPQGYPTGYCILNTGIVFPHWSALVDYWPTYIAQLKEEGSESHKDENEITRP